MVIGIMEAKCRFGERANVGVPSEGGKDAVRAASKERETVAAEVILVGTSNASEERMAVVDLPTQSRNCECKVNVWVDDVDVGVVLQTV